MTQFKLSQAAAPQTLTEIIFTPEMFTLEFIRQYQEILGSIFPRLVQTKALFDTFEKTVDNEIFQKGMIQTSRC